MNVGKDFMEILKLGKEYAKGVRFHAYNALFAAREKAGMVKIEPPKVNVKKSEKIKKVFLCMSRYEYGRKELGDSYEYLNILPAINDIASAELFDFRSYRAEHGEAGLNEHLIRIAESGEYDLMMFGLMVDDLDRKTIREISSNSPTHTLNWFSDDQWRFESFSNYWAGEFNFVVTTDRDAVARYKSFGYDNVIRSQWAVYAPRFVRSSDFGADLKVAFVGQKHLKRARMIENIEKTGVPISCFGRGWGGGRLSYQQLIDVFANAKISISPAESSVLGSPVQMKARFFEVAACGGFQLVEHVPEIYDYFEKDKEIVTYSNVSEIAELSKYYLEHEDLRVKIAKKAQERCLREHTYQKRFEHIFGEIERIAKK